MYTGSPTLNCHADYPRRIWSLRPLPPHHTCSIQLVGLALVAAELDIIPPHAAASAATDSHAASPLTTKPKGVTLLVLNPQSHALGSNPHPHTLTPTNLTPTSPPPSTPYPSSPTSTIFTLSDYSPRRAPDPPPFLDPSRFTVCSLCHRPFSPSKDIYMYRGDQAFCTKQCRQHQMLVDEQKQKSCFKC